jgi:hypothetical protein
VYEEHDNEGEDDAGEKDLDGETLNEIGSESEDWVVLEAVGVVSLGSLRTLEGLLTLEFQDSDLI